MADGLVLVPGLACDAAVWAGLALPMPAWVAEGGLQADIGAMAEALLRDAPAGRFALAGHSLGGRIALEVVRLAPQRVSRLALLDTGWQPRPTGEAGQREQAQRLALVSLAQAEGMRAMAAQWAPGMLHPACLGGAVHEAVLAMVARQSVQRFAAQQAALLARPDASAVLGAIRCPTLVLCGRQDAWSPLPRHEEMAARIAGAHLAVVEDSGHMSPMEQPAAVAAALSAWLQG
jgi:pimeloyl-ACP methyl ester carboxylesterase